MQQMQQESLQTTIARYVQYIKLCHLPNSLHLYSKMTNQNKAAVKYKSKWTFSNKKQKKKSPL